jgi:hypothetical protein
MPNKKKIDSALLAKLEALCAACPKGCYASTCPFRLLNTLSHHTRRSLLEDMTLERVHSLFDLAEICACPADSRKSEPVPIGPQTKHGISLEM